MEEKLKMENSEKIIVENNSDFIFLFDAKQTNPNGDPDMENKPRMDYETKTNLVSKYRKKRDIRDYAKTKGKLIFIDTEAERKVSAEQRLNSVMDAFLSDENKSLEKLDIWNSCLEKLKGTTKKSKKEIYALFKEISEKTNSDKKTNEDKFINENFKRLNNDLLTYIVKSELYDIRLFGSTFPVVGFTKIFTGPVQINWGYSLHPVELMKSSSLVTIMNDDSSTFGKDYCVEYSLIAFNGTISKNMASKTDLTEKDIELFRESIIKSTGFSPTSSKANQRPLAYFEVQYKKEHDGFLGDLRNYIEFEKDSSQRIIRNRKDVKLNADKLKTLLSKPEISSKIEKIIIWESPLLEDDQLVFKDFSVQYKNEEEKELVDKKLLKEIV